MSPTEQKNDDSRRISGFSKLSKLGKIKWLVEHFFKDRDAAMRELISYWHVNEEQQKILDGFSENTISNFPMPFGVAPNFLINGKTYVVPMVIEESSVVAAASAGAKFWMDRGGFKTEVLGTKKLGQLHFNWKGEVKQLRELLPSIQLFLLARAKDITENMEQRGGGVTDFKLIQFDELADYYQLLVSFETCDSMGANFINSVLETFAEALQEYFAAQIHLPDHLRDVEILMAILSNYTPQCIVKASVHCPIDQLGNFANGIDAQAFATKFYQAVKIAELDTYRATTHNKGIFNGVDAVILATGNDFRAIEAAGHTYASRNGRYASLSSCSIDNNEFQFSLEMPIALGTIGGLTALHPIARRSLELLGNPSAEELMQIVVATGLAQNFAAIRSLVTTGIQEGHMKMHLQNMLRHFSATHEEIGLAETFFQNNKISFSSVRAFISDLRSK